MTLTPYNCGCYPSGQFRNLPAFVHVSWCPLNQDYAEFVAAEAREARLVAAFQWSLIAAEVAFFIWLNWALS